MWEQIMKRKYAILCTVGVIIIFCLVPMNLKAITHVLENNGNLPYNGGREDAWILLLALFATAPVCNLWRSRRGRFYVLVLQIALYYIHPVTRTIWYWFNPGILDYVIMSALGIFLAAHVIPAKKG